MKYEFTAETKQINGVTLYRIRAITSFGTVKEGDWGGFIEKDSNLSQEGDAWVSGNACVYGDACIYGNVENADID